MTTVVAIQRSMGANLAPRLHLLATTARVRDEVLRACRTNAPEASVLPGRQQPFHTRASVKESEVFGEAAVACAVRCQSACSARPAPRRPCHNDERWLSRAQGRRAPFRTELRLQHPRLRMHDPGPKLRKELPGEEAGFSSNLCARARPLAAEPLTNRRRAISQPTVERDRAGWPYAAAGRARTKRAGEGERRGEGWGSEQGSRALGRRSR